MTWRTRDMTALKIAPPPSEGIYLGQYEWVAGDISSRHAKRGGAPKCARAATRENPYQSHFI